MTPEELKSLDIKILIANTYHLYLRPGVSVIESMGGLHRFMGWDRPLITDSGGYQIFSLAGLRDISDEGVTFRSHIDGSQHLITPERAVQYQESLGADFIMVLDECPPSTAAFEQVEEAMERTHKWAERCQKAQTRDDQTLFAIVQGGIFPELRRRSASFLTSLDFDGYAIGGLSLGESKTVTGEIVEETVGLLTPNKPRHLMGLCPLRWRGKALSIPGRAGSISETLSIAGWRHPLTLTAIAIPVATSPPLTCITCFGARSFWHIG